jgi:tape measure domain-containing protein
VTEDYGIAVKVDPGAAVANAARVAAELGKAEQAGERAGAAISRGMRESSVAAEHARDQMGRFVSAARQGSTATESAARSTGVAIRAFDGLTEALRREQVMLDRINGPLRRYEQGLQTLDSLHARGRVSTEQWAEQVRKLNRELERGSTIKQTAPVQAAPAVAKGGGGLLASVGGGLAAAGLAFGAREVLSMASSYQDLQNKMRVVAGEGESVSSVFSRIQGAADATRSSLAATTSAYQRLSGATREMGMSSDSLLRLTERINKAVKVSGASTGEAQAATQQLSQALASGRLQGDEFRSIGENAPYVLGILAESLGVTRGKLRELASEGKLTSSVVVGAFERMGSKIDKDFGKTVPTLADQWAMLQDKLTLVVGKVLEASGTFEVLGGALGVVGDVLGLVGDVVGGLKGAFDSALSSLGVFGDALRTILNPLKLVRDGIAAIKDFARSEAAAEAAVGGGGVRALNPSALRERGEISAADAKAYLAEMEALKKLHSEYEKIDKIGATLGAARAAGVDGLPAFDVETAKRVVDVSARMKRAFGIEVPAAFDEATKRSMALAAGLDKLKEQQAADKLAADVKRAANATLAFNETLVEHARQWQTLEDKQRGAQFVLAQIAKDRADLARVTGKDPLIEMTSGADALSRTRLELATQRELRDVKLEMANVEYEYGATVVRVTKAEQERVDSMNDLKGALEGGRISARAFLDEVKRYGDAAGQSLDMMIQGLDTAVTKLAAARPAPLAPSRQEIEAMRQSRDLRIQAKYADEQHGAVIVKNRLEELHRKDALEDVNGALRVGGITTKQYWEEMKRLGFEAGKATEILKSLTEPSIEWSKTISALNSLLRQGRIDLQQYNTELAKLAESQPVRTGEMPRGSSLVGGRRLGGQELAIGYEELSAEQQERADRRARPSTLAEMGIGTSIDTSWMDDLLAKQRQAGGVLEDNALKTAAWNRELELLKLQSQDDGFARGFEKIRAEVTDVAGALESSLVNAFSNAEEALIAFVTTGEFSMRKFVDSALADLTRLLIRQAAVGLIGAFAGGGAPSVFGTGATQAFSGLFGSAPGYARGGEGRIAGSGPPDSKLFMARVTPGEYFRFVPPGQPTERAQPAQQAAPVVQIVPTMDESPMTAVLERQGERYHLAWSQRNRSAQRGRTSGR